VPKDVTVKLLEASQLLNKTVLFVDVSFSLLELVDEFASSFVAFANSKLTILARRFSFSLFPNLLLFCVH